MATEGAPDLECTFKPEIGESVDRSFEKDKSSKREWINNREYLWVFELKGNHKCIQYTDHRVTHPELMKTF